jgi:beta-hydroxyacyl-ACP dehydratase FabZ
MADIKTMDIMEIMELLPHRYPFLMVDRITNVEDKKITGIKNVTMNEPQFQGHFPGQPVMPGVLMVEGMAQCGGILAFQSVPNPKEKLVYFASIDSVKFRRPVVPGDTIRYEIQILRFSGKICKMKGEVFVGEELACSADMLATLMDRPKA